MLCQKQAPYSRQAIMLEMLFKTGTYYIEGYNENDEYLKFGFLKLSLYNKLIQYDTKDIHLYFKNMIVTDGELIENASN